MMRRGVHLLKRPPQIAAAIQCRWGESPREPNSVSRRDYRDSGVLSGLRYGLAGTLAPPAFWLPSVLSRSLAFLLAAAISLISSTFAFSANETIASESDQTTQILEPSLTEKNRQHWSFRPLHRSKPPHVKNESQVRNEIDRFILVDLEAEGLRLAPEASRETLIRRVHFDLIGLPPSPAQIDAFANDASPDAYEKVVNRLLVADGYGEHWAQHWLDLARFAQSDGFEHDKVRPDAWRYRDWVIRALNDDLPYDQFVQWQIAGDELAPDNPDAALATGFLLSGPDMPDINLAKERQHNVLNELTSAVGASILGLGIGCAQCHDHKYDPVSQADFYRMRAFFSNLDVPPKNKSLMSVFLEKGSEMPISKLMIRGDFRRPGPSIDPGYIRVVSRPTDQVKASPIAEKSTGQRSELARWLTRPDHPLTLRVIANRLWLHHFSRALVSTPNDFGTQGQKPTHPALLDWLATELPKRDWSLKSMHRLIVMSATYRQASAGKGDEWTRKLEVDPRNRLYSRMHRQRLSGEAVRDAMLQIANQLNRKPGGSGFRPPLPREVTVTLLKNQWPVTKDATEHTRRSVYLFARRNLRYPMFDVFDRPDALASCAQRNHSTTAPQSLTLFNSEFSLTRARAVADLILGERDRSLNDHIVDAYRRILGRRPGQAELATGKAFISTQTRALKEERQQPPQLEPTSTDPHLAAAFTDYCLALFNLNEFLYVD
jgi:hypothetical protein